MLQVDLPLPRVRFLVPSSCLLLGVMTSPFPCYCTYGVGARFGVHRELILTGFDIHVDRINYSKLILILILPLELPKSDHLY